MEDGHWDKILYNVDTCPCSRGSYILGGSGIYIENIYIYVCMYVSGEVGILDKLTGEISLKRDFS